MTNPQLMGLKAVAILALLLGVFWAGWHERGVRAERDTAKTELQSYKDFGKAILERDQKFATTQAKLTALEERYTQDQTNALNTNAALRNDLAVAQRMRLKGAYCPAQAAAGAASAGMGDAVPLGLSEETRLAVFDLRESIVRDTAALTACQAELAARLPSQ